MTLFSNLEFSLEQGAAFSRKWQLITAVCLYGTSLSGFQAKAAAADCPYRPVVERLKQYKVQPRETLAQIANRYGLLSATIMGMNPTVRSGKVVAGQTLTIAPYNGILVSLAAGQTLQSAAKAYNVRPDVLFEVNGCQLSPKVVFVPGVNWSPVSAASTAVIPLITPAIGQPDALARQDRYPLPQAAALRRPYGWQPTGPNSTVVFASGVDLTAAQSTPVYAVADGTVAFAGVQKPWGNFVVLNHAQGRQTRYGYLGNLRVKVGQTVRRGQIIAAIGAQDSALHFELRYRSAIGWVAQDPQPYLQAIAGAAGLKKLEP